MTYFLASVPMPDPQNQRYASDSVN